MSSAQPCLLLRNARVYLPDGTVSSPTTIAILGETIAAIGKRAAVPPPREEIDLRGRLVLPGFIDNHVHFLKGGESLLGLDLRDADTPEEFAARIRQRVSRTPKGEWITGGRWDNSRWPGPGDVGWPHRDLLDDFSPEIPILVSRTDGHVALANLCALKLARITPDTPPPPGGAIDHDAHGQLTGILRDAALHLVQRHIPEPSESEKEQWVRAALQRAASLGVTSVTDFDASGTLPIYQRLLDTGALTCRINYCPPIARWESPADAGSPDARRSLSSDMIRVGGVKAFVDGSLGARTAWMFEPFRNEPKNAGLATEDFANGMLERQMLAADRAGIQLAIHAIGDRANAAFLDIIERMIRENGRRDRRIRVEHAQHLRAEDFARFAQLGAIASVQPPHILLDAFQASKALGAERAARTYAFRSLLDAGARVTFGTDWPVVSLNPLEAIYAAVTRTPLDGSFPDGWFPEQAVTVHEAIRCCTVESAYAEFQEHRKGSIAPGMLADLVVLSEDITAIPPKAIKDVSVLMTIVGSRIVYRSPDAS